MEIKSMEIKQKSLGSPKRSTGIGQSSMKTPDHPYELDINRKTSIEMERSPGKSVPIGHENR